jgi:mRNA interferase RelE/StbE
VTYELIFDREAVEFLESCQKNLRERIFNRITAAKENPFHFFERMEGRQDYKLRVGDYRVIADINRSIGRIEVTLIDHRKNIYKKLARK